VCILCTSEDWKPEGVPITGSVSALEGAHAEGGSLIQTQPHGLSEAPVELHRLEEMDEPSLIECLEAELAAKRAIAEEAAEQAKVLEHRLSCLTKHSKSSERNDAAERASASVN